MVGKSWTYALIAVFWVGVALPAAAWAQDAVIQGSVGLVSASRQFVPGANVRLFLVTEPIEIQSDLQLDHLEKFDKFARLNECHVNFFVQFREKMSRPDYAVADTLSADDGRFQFAGIPAGRYWILVTFPTIIDGCKVAWQVPVTVDAGARVDLDLRNFNMALPTASRY